MEKEKKKLSMMKPLMHYYKPYLRTFILDTLFAILSAAVALVIPMVVRYITSEVIYLDAQDMKSRIIQISVFLIVLVAFQYFCNFYITCYGHIMGAKIEYDMRLELFSHYQELPFSFYDDQKVGQLMSRITSDLFDISELLHHGPENLIISLIKIAGAFIILINVSVKLTAATFILVPFMLIYAYFLNKKMKKAFAKNRVEIAEINARIEDNLSGIRVVKSFANEDIERKKFNVGNDGFLNAKKESYYYMGKYHSGLNAFTIMINVIVIIAGGIMIAQKTINVTDFITFLLYINIFTDPIRTLIDFAEQFQNGYSGYERFIKMMNVQSDIKDSENAEDIKDVKGNVEFNDVSFKYNDDAHRVLKHINLSVKSGEYVAIVGPSGVGKSTLLNLLPRFYDVTRGEITLDGKNIKDIKIRSLRNNIGVVQQDVYLFAGTIFDNILYGKPDATREEVVEAARNANAYDFIMSLPKGFDTDIGQRGIKLSGGQKQRLSIARVFLKNPAILIFDEATSALDNESEKIVQESLESLAKNRTTFVIAHRLSTIKNAEKILVLTNDGIEEEGTHDELMKLGGIYSSLYQMSFR